MGQKQPIDREGEFRGQITDYLLREEKSGAICLVITADLMQMWDRDCEEWIEWGQYQMEAHGNIYLVLKNGGANENQVKALCRCADWDGDLVHLAQKAWKPSPCQFQIKQSTYNNKTELRIEWLNSYDNTPGVGTICDMVKVSDLQSRLGASLRAIAGNARRAAIAPNGAPPSPPSPPPLARPQVPQPVNANNQTFADPNSGEDGIPF